MAASADNASMALFCDFENIALGVRDAQYEKFDIRPVLERLLAKGSIVVKKAYCDWDRYRGFKAAMHEANFELIEIPHVRQSGKNSADIRMVVDALDLCYTKSHVDTFVIISGDSDFSPLVSKLRENAKRVIGVGVKQSCSDLLVTNCDEFIYYDDLVRDRESTRSTERREREKRSPEEEAKRREKQEERKNKAVDLVATTFADMMADRGENERIWASVLKEVIKRRNPGFNETYYGFRSFGNLLEEAAGRGLLAVGRDEKSGTYVTRAAGRPADQDGLANEASETSSEAASEAMPQADAAAVHLTETAKTDTPVEAGVSPTSDEAKEDRGNARRRGGRRPRKPGREREAAGGEVVESTGAPLDVVVEPVPVVEPLADSPAPQETPVVAEKTEAEPAKPRRGGRRPRKTVEEATPVTEVVTAAPTSEPVVVPSEETKEKKPVRRAPRARKPKVAAE